MSEPMTIERAREIIDAAAAGFAAFGQQLREARDAIARAFPFYLPHRTAGWVKWTNDATARRCFRSFGHAGRKRTWQRWAREHATLVLPPLGRSVSVVVVDEADLGGTPEGRKVTT